MTLDISSLNVNLPTIIRPIKRVLAATSIGLDLLLVLVSFHNCFHKLFLGC
jgi:hypothetical protein